MRVCVTGATGFLGSRVVAELLARGHEVRSSGRGAALENRIAPEQRGRLLLVVGRLDRAGFCREFLDR